MTSIQEVTASIYTLVIDIPGSNITCTVYFIKDGGGAIIEPGPATAIPGIQAGARELGISHPEYIISTHLHLDHAGGTGGLARLYPNVRVVANPVAARHFIDPTRLIQSTGMAFGEDYINAYGQYVPVPEAQIIIAEDGEELPLGSRRLTILHTPGHAPHHISILDSKTRGLFSGEALGLIYQEGTEPLISVAPPGFDAEANRETMNRLRKLRPEIIFYSHGGVITETEAAIETIIRNTELIGDFIFNAMQNGQTNETVISSTGDYLRQRFGVDMDEYDLKTNVSGFIHYFRKKGIV